MVDKNDFQLPSPEALEENENFQILSVFQEHELGNLNRDSVIVQAMNSMAKSFYKHMKSPPTWKILGVPKRCESELRNRLNLHSKLDVVFARMPSDKGLKDELCQCHLVLVPPSSTHYVNLTLAAMCAAVPVIIPWGSLSHDLIKRHLRDHESWLVVDMNESDALREGIMRFLCQYNVALNKAKKIKEEVWNKVGQELENINETFLNVVKEDAEAIHSVTLRRQQSPQEQKDDREDDKEKQAVQSESNMSPRKRKWQGRDPGDMKVRMKVSEVVPERGRTVQEVERGFYESDEVKKKTEEVGQSLDGQHDKMNVKGIGHESISYTMSCQSLDALECLVGQYENGKLQDLMEDEFLSDELLDKIGAYYLAIDVTIDYEEYLMCRKELIQIYGLPSETNDQEQDTDKTRSMKSQEIDVYKIPSRVNRARDLLKEFEMEGETVTETQINTLDKLLQEKAQRRLLDHQQRLQESAKEVTNVHLLTDEEITEKNEDLVAKVNELTISSGIVRSQNRDRGRGREILQSVVTDGDRIEERKLNTIFSEFVEVKCETRDLVTNYPEMEMKAEKLSAYADHIVREAEIPEETKKVYMDVRRAEKVILPWNVTVDEDNDQYFMSDRGNGQVVVSSGQSKILNCFGRKEGIDPTGICLSPDGFIFIGDLNGYVRKYNKSGEHIARTEEGQVSHPWDLIVNKKCIFVSDYVRDCVHVLNHQMQSIRDIGKGHLQEPWGLCFDHQQDGIYVCDRSGHRVVHFNCDGEFLSYKGQGQLENPRYIALCKDNPYRLVVTQDYCVKLLYI
ncbi:uncharacterized protein [Ptychodera flava]|uniref:uncharacterized protein n=1 Tax=Ptychodera flava TaxID=63121 RepID=UPI003969ECF7